MFEPAETRSNILRSWQWTVRTLERRRCPQRKPSCLLFMARWSIPPRIAKGRNLMSSDISHCRAMEVWCRQRARAEPGKSWKWLGQAERWRELAHDRIAFKFQKRSVHQQIYAGPMQMGPNTVKGD